jgi:formylglycine-generating enzyme required for sulfatase activity
MGADDIEAANPQHLVYQLDYDFYIGRYPVTNQEYSLYLRGTGQSIVMAKDKADHPIVNVSLMHAQGYADWLNRKYQVDLPAGYTFQLPSEPEWEKSARGAAGNEYPWGNNFDTRRCNSKEGGKNGTTSVGTYSPQGDSAFGAADMAGNVWEWTRSRGRPYPYRFDDDSEDKIGNLTLTYVLRGGSFMSEKVETRCATRSWLDATAKREDVGFRVVLSSR